MNRESKSTRNRVTILGLIIAVFIVNGSVLAQPSTCLNLSTTLRIGGSQTSTDVISLQNYLYSKGYLTVSPTGYFGRLTDLAVKKFQSENGISTVGIVGPITRAKIFELSCSSPAVISVPVPPLVNPVINLTPIITPSLVITTNIDQNISIKTFKLPYSSTDFSNWQKSWGNVSTSSIKLTLDANTGTYGGQVIFPDSSSLTDYRYIANVFIRRGSFVLIARYVNDENFVACNFGGRTVEIIQRLNGVTETVASAYVADFPNSRFFFDDINVSMNVKGKKVGCILVGGQDNVSFANIDSSLLKGGVGIQNWYDTLGIASLELKKVTLEAI